MITVPNLADYQSTQFTYVGDDGILLDSVLFVVHQASVDSMRYLSRK